jgi:hypothetical protein
VTVATATLTLNNSQNKTENGYYLNEKYLWMLDLPL